MEAASDAAGKRVVEWWRRRESNLADSEARALLVVPVACRFEVALGTGVEIRTSYRRRQRLESRVRTAAQSSVFTDPERTSRARFSSSPTHASAASASASKIV